MNSTIEQEHEQIDLRKVLAEIDNLRAATLKMQAETQRAASETQKLNAETLKTQIEAQTFKVWHLVAAAVATVVFLAALKSLSLLPIFS